MEVESEKEGKVEVNVRQERWKHLPGYFPYFDFKIVHSERKRLDIGIPRRYVGLIRGHRSVQKIV